VVTVILSFVAHEVIDAIALIFIILIDVLMGTYQEWKARKDAESLINMIKVTTRVIRNGGEMQINSSDIVVGDILVLESGDKISADARIIECHNFQVDESALTGESLNVTKNNDVLPSDVSLAERKNMIYAGTAVTTGRAHAVVVSTGINTEIGRIADKVTNTEEEKSPLTIRTEKFSKQISIIIVIVAIITTIVLLSKGFRANEIFLCVIALSVSAMPEGLPLALTMALTIASKRMAKKNVIVKKLNAVESLGSCTVIASDKTGTLTVNEQTAKEIVMANGETFTISGTGYNAEGKVTPVGNADIKNAEYIAELGALNNEAHLEKKDGKWESFGDSIDIAFLSLAAKMKINNKPKIIESIPYESENQYSAVFYEKDGETYCTVKGSLEKVMTFSEENKKYYSQNEELTKKGYRVIAIADGKVEGTTQKDIKNLNFIGMVAFIDPIRKEVKDSLKECSNAGIKVVMVTGDHPLTAFAIAKELGLCSKESEVATGRDIEKYRSMGEKEFDKFISCIKVFSRVTPIDKLDIVNSFKRQGEFVAVTGDGVNDAPAIKSANIGIAMGSGTDVAKETASMIVADDNFTSIVSGVKEGRTAYSNIRKITLFLLGCGFAEVCFFLLSIAFGYDIPLLAIQLLWLNIVTDGLQDVALSFEKAEKNIMKEKPRDTKESLFSKDLMIEVLILGITISAIVFGTWKYMMDKNYDIVFARSVIMMLMVFIQNINVLNCRSEKRSVFKESLLDNPFVIATVIGSILLQVIISEIPATAMFL
ncbi:MAG: HAD-IC family P-type ATPase, partial [Bacilli bacterium]|nr:HAD-IC family P-type ATPase [Bacilli bacterium]